MKILHLIINHQVMERVLGKYENLFPECNDVLVFTNDGDLKHLHKYSTRPQITRRSVKKEGKSFDFSGYNYIVAHFLTLEMIDFISFAPSKIHVSWTIFGADLYNQFLKSLGYRLQYSDSSKYASLATKILEFIGFRKLFLFFYLGIVSQFDFVNKRYFNKISKRLDSLQISCDCDADLFELYSGRKIMRYKVFAYSLKEVLGDLYNTPFNGDAKDIMIGNSASLTNNHLYVLGFVKGIELENSKIIIPFSYGGVPRYKKDVIEKYEKAFNDNVTFLMDYMPLHEYNKLFTTIKTVVMASWRQESFGTIIMCLYLGIKIYMSEKSPLFSCLKKEGFIIYSIEETNNKRFICPLSNNDKKYNRELLLNKYNDDFFDAELRRQFI